MAEFALKGLAIASKLIESRIREQVLFDLKESDVIGQHFREFVIKELESIKEKLDGLARVDLLASLDFFKDGITLLHGHLERVAIQDLPKEQKDTEMFSTSLAYKFLGLLGIYATPELHNVVVSDEDQTDNSFIVEAKEKFDKAIECSVKAISNDALRIVDRIFAARLRIIGTILKHIDDCAIPLSLCKSYINQLNSNAEVLNNIKVHFGKGLGSAMRKKLYSDERNQLVWSVVSINRLVWNYAFACNADSSYFADWPLFLLDDDESLHPVLDGAVREMFSWILDDSAAKLSCPEGIAVACNGCFVVADTLNECIKIFSSGGHYMFACKLPQTAIQDVADDETQRFEDVDSNDEAAPVQPVSSSVVESAQDSSSPISFNPRCVAVDGDLTIFAGSSRGRREDPPIPAKVITFKKNGNFDKIFEEDILNSNSILTSMVVDSDNKRLLVSDDHAHCIHSFSVKGEYLARICNWDDHEDYSHIAVNENGHIFVTHWDHVRIYDRDGNFVSKFITEYGIPLGGIAYDMVRQQVFVLCKAYKHLDKNSKPNLQVLDKEWDLQGMIELPKSYRSSKSLAVTLTGFVAVVNVDNNEVIVV